MASKDKSRHSIFWHPHQKFWNQRLVSITKKWIPIKILTRFILKCIIYFDTFLLGLNLKWNPKNINKSNYSSGKKINYFDLGTHKEAEELQWIIEEVLSDLPNPYQVLAFEANPDSYNHAHNIIKHFKNTTFLNIALVNKIPDSGQVRLYKKGGGIGDSIYRSNYAEHVDIPAKKLSDIIKEKNINIDNSINILRMNIEGCEMDVIADLIQSDFIKHFDGFYGMWDDVGKIDYKRDVAFRALLKKENIHPYPFNGRDMVYTFRKKLIKKSLEKTIFGMNGQI